jgi:hypothetical protein
MGWKVERPKPKTEVPGWLGALIIVVALVGVYWAAKQLAFPTFHPCEACEGTGILSCGAPGCVHGKVRCPGSCLKKDDPGWFHMEVAGHSPDDLWMRFDNDDGSWQAWNQNHIGDSIVKVNGQWTDEGKCQICGGTGLAPCPVCHAKKLCEVCDGTGRVRDWGFF